MLKLATLLQNPGEAAVSSRYEDPAELSRLGYNGVVLYETNALSGLQPGAEEGSLDLRHWVETLADSIDQKVKRCVAAGLKVYLAFDALTVARNHVGVAPAGVCCEGSTDVVCPGSSAVRTMGTGAAEAWLARWPECAGIVLRMGDSEGQRVPHLVGNDVYQPRCPQCRNMAVADRLIDQMAAWHRVIHGRCGRDLMVRAWNVAPGGLHDRPDLMATLAERINSGALAGSESESATNASVIEGLLLSFKCTQADFWRYQPWNQSSFETQGIPVIYELQCQREFEGKGAMPNWQAPLWRDGQAEAGDGIGLAEAAAKVNFAGVWAWVRGGGWGGPFVTDETWIDANVFSAPRLAENPSLDLDELLEAWLSERLSSVDRLTSTPLRAVIGTVLKASPDLIRDTFYLGPPPEGEFWRPAGDWIRDDLLDVTAAITFIGRLADVDLDPLVQAQSKAANEWGRLRAMVQDTRSEEGSAAAESCLASLAYAESLAKTLRGLVTALVIRRRIRAGLSSDSAGAQRAILSAQSHWNHHTQRLGAFSSASTPFSETGLWEVSQEILEAQAESRPEDGKT